MKNLLIISAALIFFTACGKVDDQYYGQSAKNDYSDQASQYDWREVGDVTTNNFIDRYFRQSGSYWYFRTKNDGIDNGGQYWPGAHAMDLVVDAYIRSKDDPARADEAARYLGMFPTWFNGQRQANWAGTSSWKNPYIDDMEWNVITMLNLYENHPTPQATWLSTAKQVYDDWIWSVWDTFADVDGGGLLWSHDATVSKNACSNGPGSIIACKLSKLLTDQADKEKYLAQAQKIYNWQKSVLYNPATGAVYDNITAGKISTVSLTYNQGTFLGTAHMLYQLTGEKSYLYDAAKIADFTITSLIDTKNNVLRNEGTGDGGMFKGIFIRYFVLLINEPALDAKARERFTRFLKHQAVVLWTKGVDKKTEELLFSPDWTTPAYVSQEMGAQASGCIVMEAMNLLKK